jgi:ribosomal protein S6
VPGYELVFILNPTLTEEDFSSLMGNYILEKIQINQTSLKELDASLKLTDDVLRYLFIREKS